MAVKNSETRTSRPARIAAKQIYKGEEEPTGFFDFLRFGESYTSLILGIVVVVIATILLLSLVRNRNVSKVSTSSQQTALQTQKIAHVQQTKNVLKIEHKNKTVSQAKPQTKAKIAQAPKKMIAQNKVVQKTIPPTISGSTYTVAAGDTLWKIAEDTYKSGYNWVDIAQANKLPNPGVIYKGMKLTLPKVQPKLATVTTSTNGTTMSNQTTVQTVADTNKIIGTSYTIQKGDNLWSISVRAYGDGYQWEKIAKANNLTNNPGLIHSGNTLSIPRG